MTTPTRFVFAATVLMGFSPLGCSSSTDHDTTTHTPAASDAAPPLEEVDAGAAAGTSLKAPLITQIMKMSGGLHLVWTNNQKDCESIEGERKAPGGTYEVVFTIPDGSVNNKHDAPLTAGTMYTYRVRCMKGAAASPYSNEKSAAP